MQQKNTAFLEPAFFTIVLGTGALSVATMRLAQTVSWLVPVAWILNILNTCVLVALLLFAGKSWSQNRDMVLAAMDAPQRSAFFSALGISFLVFAAQALNFHMGLVWATMSWTIGVLLTWGLNLATLYRVFLKPDLELEQFAPTFFIPVAGLVVVPVAGSALWQAAAGAAQEAIVLVCVISLGAGLLLYLGLFALMLQRHVLRPPLADQMVPTVWIHMAPIGWGAVSLLGVGQMYGDEAGPVAAQLLASLMWGGGLWWLIMAVMLTLRSVLRRQLHFSLAWWGFIFPLDSMTVLSTMLDMPGAGNVAWLLWLLTVALWLACAWGTVRFLHRGRS